MASLIFLLTGRQRRLSLVIIGATSASIMNLVHNEPGEMYIRSRSHRGSPENKTIWRWARRAPFRDVSHVFQKPLWGTPTDENKPAKRTRCSVRLMAHAWLGTLVPPVCSSSSWSERELSGVSLRRLPFTLLRAASAWSVVHCLQQLAIFERLVFRGLLK